MIINWYSVFSSIIARGMVMCSASWIWSNRTWVPFSLKVLKTRYSLVKCVFQPVIKQGKGIIWLQSGTVPGDWNVEGSWDVCFLSSVPWAVYKIWGPWCFTSDIFRFIWRDFKWRGRKTREKNTFCKSFHVDTNVLLLFPEIIMAARKDPPKPAQNSTASLKSKTGRSFKL